MRVYFQFLKEHVAYLDETDQSHMEEDTVEAKEEASAEPVPCSEGGEVNGLRKVNLSDEASLLEDSVTEDEAVVSELEGEWYSGLICCQQPLLAVTLASLLLFTASLGCYFSLSVTVHSLSWLLL